MWLYQAFAVCSALFDEKEQIKGMNEWILFGIWFELQISGICSAPKFQFHHVYLICVNISMAFADFIIKFLWKMVGTISMTKKNNYLNHPHT